MLGGGVIQALADHMMGPMVEVARDHILSHASKAVEIVASKLGDDAGITGAALLAKRQRGGVLAAAPSKDRNHFEFGARERLDVGTLRPALIIEQELADDRVAAVALPAPGLLVNAGELLAFVPTETRSLPANEELIAEANINLGVNDRRWCFW